MTGDLGAGVNDVELAWRSLPKPSSSQLEAQRLVGWPGGPVLAALSSDGSRHLLIGVPDGHRTQPASSTRGLHIEVRRLRILDGGERNWLDLSCDLPAHYRVFGALAADIVATLTGIRAPDTVKIAAVVNRWRAFWTVVPGSLSKEQQLGLLGELWLLTRWLPAVTLRSVVSWEGPVGGRHDFASPQISVEVKTTSAPSGPTVHRIQSLDQLTPPVTGALTLLSLRFLADALGDLSLDSVVDDARSAAAAEGALPELDTKLAAAGWSLADRGEYAQRWRLTHESLFEVGDGFPCLTANSFAEGLPAGIVDLSYALDVTACAPWQIENQPSPTSRLLDLLK